MFSEQIRTSVWDFFLTSDFVRKLIDQGRLPLEMLACRHRFEILSPHTFPICSTNTLLFLSTSGYAKEDIYFYQHIVRLSFRNREGHTKNIWGARAINIYLTSLQLPFFPGIYSGNRERSRFQRPICSHALIVIHMVCM